MIVSPKIILQDAKENGYAVPSFNYYNLDVLFAVLDAAEEEDAPVIVQPYMAYFPFQHYEVFSDATLRALRQTNVSSAIHLDHCTDYDMTMRAIRAGFTSVMIDGSTLPLDDNIKLTKSVVDAAKSVKVFTEAEVGHIYRVGVDANAEDEEEIAATEDCVRLVKETGVDSLAAAVGTAHGIYTKPPVINFDRIREIASSVDVPLVLHGGSGTPDDMIQEAIRCGISKINVGTELKHAWSHAMKKGLDEGELEPRVLSAYAREQVKNVARKKFRLFGTSGKNPEIVEKLKAEGTLQREPF